MSNLTEEEQLRAERLRKKNLQNFIMNQNRLASQGGKSFNGNQLVNNHNQSYQNDAYGQSNSSRKEQRYLPRIAQNRKSYDLDDVHRDRYAHDKNENDKTEVYLKNCEEIIKNLRQLKQKKKAMDERRLATQPYSPKQHTRSQSYGGSPNRNFSSQGTPYNKVLPPLNDYRTPISRSRQYGIDSGQRQKSKNYHVRNNSHSLSHRSRHSNSVPLQQHSRQAIRQDTEMPQGFHEDATPSESNSKASSGLKQNSNRMEDQLVKQKEQFNECIVELTKFLKQQNNSRVEQNSGSTSRVEHENREEFQMQNGNKSQRKKETIEGDALELIPQTHNQDNNENSQEADDETQKQKMGTLIEATITALKQLKDKQKNRTHENSKKDSRIINKDNLSRAQQNKINEKTMQSQRDFDTSKSYQQTPSKDPQTQDDKKNELLKLLMKHIQKQDSKNDELSFCLKELTKYLKDQNNQLQEIKNSRHNRYEDEVINEFPEEGQQKARQQPKKYSQKGKNINPKQENQKKNVKQNFQNNSNVQPTQQAHQNQTAISQSSPEVQNAIIKNLKKARLRGSLFSQKLSSFKKQHTKMNYFLSNKEDSTRLNEPPNEPNQQHPSNN